VDGITSACGIVWCELSIATERSATSDDVAHMEWSSLQRQVTLHPCLRVRSSSGCLHIASINFSLLFSLFCTNNTRTIPAKWGHGISDFRVSLHLHFTKSPPSPLDSTFQAHALFANTYRTLRNTLHSNFSYIHNLQFSTHPIKLALIVSHLLILQFTTQDAF
jgi:hypothetical protein